MDRRHLAHADRRRLTDGADPQRLIRLIDELRALDVERRKQPVTSPAFQELAQRMEQKAREVFEEAAAKPPPIEGDSEAAAQSPH
jgi:hypothetical protein